MIELILHQALPFLVELELSVESLEGRRSNIKLYSDLARCLAGLHQRLQWLVSAWLVTLHGIDMCQSNQGLSRRGLEWLWDHLDATSWSHQRTTLFLESLVHNFDGLYSCSHAGFKSRTNSWTSLCLCVCTSYVLCPDHKGSLTPVTAVACPSLYRVGILKWHTRDVAAKPLRPPVAQGGHCAPFVFVCQRFSVFY